MSEEAIEQVAQPEATPMETPAEVAQGGSGNDFLQMVPEELREHPSLSPIKDVENLARSYVNAQRLIGADKIPVPVNPTDEDLDNIYNRLGRPETVDGYEIAVDGNVVTEDVAKSYADIAHKLRLTPDQASGIMDYYRSMASQASEVTAEAETQQRSQTEMSLRKEWGDDFDARIEDAGKIAQQFGGGELLEMKLADGTKVGNHPDFIKAFAKMAEFRQSVTSEDTVSDAPSSSIVTRQSAQQELDAIMNDKSHVYWDRKNVIGRQAAIERVQDLMGVLHGTG
jgi:uncharacterized protein YoaH (UPF0181 family)